MESKRRPPTEGLDPEDIPKQDPRRGLPRLETAREGPKDTQGDRRD
jgi:hypothetical protein